MRFVFKEIIYQIISRLCLGHLTIAARAVIRIVFRVSIIVVRADFIFDVIHTVVVCTGAEGCMRILADRCKAQTVKPILIHILYRHGIFQVDEILTVCFFHIQHIAGTSITVELHRKHSIALHFADCQRLDVCVQIRFCRCQIDLNVFTISRIHARNPALARNRPFRAFAHGKVYFAARKNLAAEGRVEEGRMLGIQSFRASVSVVIGAARQGAAAAKVNI